jgi:hypothetical protein
VAGDALWAAMMLWWVSAAGPRVRWWGRAGAAYAACVGVELSQLVHTPLLDAVRGSSLGHLVLGSDFHARDLVAYGAGIVAAVSLECAVVAGARRRRAVPPASSPNER